MASSRKMRADAVAVQTLRTGRGVNDNSPGLVPGHRMSDLDGVPRQPAAETVIHYARVAEIGSFPETAPALAQAVETPTLDCVVERRETIAPKRAARSIAAGLMSCLAHAAVFSLLAVTMVAVPEEPVEEAGAVVSVTMLGESEFDQLAAGDPEIIQSEAVQPEELTPAEPEPVAIRPVAPTEVQPETPPAAPQVPMVSNEPEVLAAIVPAEPVVAQAAPVMVPAQPAAPVEAVSPTVVAPVMPMPEKPIEQPVAKKPAPKKPVAREKPVEKPKSKKPTPKKAGSKGDAAEDRKRGSTDGSQIAEANRDGSRTAGRNATGAGSAAVANYPGKVQSKIRRAVRVPSAFRRERASMSVRVRLTVVSSGQLGSVSVARSSGVSALDEAVVNGVRRAAPFPPLPSEWGKPSWTFTQEVQVTGR